MNDVVAHGTQVRVTHEGISIGFCRSMFRIILGIVLKLA